MNEVYVCITTLRSGAALGPLQTFRRLVVFADGKAAWAHKQGLEAMLPVDVEVSLCPVDEATPEPAVDAAGAQAIARAYFAERGAPVFLSMSEVELAAVVRRALNAGGAGADVLDQLFDASPRSTGDTNART